MLRKGEPLKMAFAFYFLIKFFCYTYDIKKVNFKVMKKKVTKNPGVLICRPSTKIIFL